MLVAYAVVAIAAAIANGFSATCDFVRFERVLVVMRNAGVPESWIVKLGVPKALGAIGLLVGIAVPFIGIAAAVGLVIYFVGAIIAHVRVRDTGYPLAFAFLTLAVAALVLRLLA
jgi:DoxX-like family